MQNQYLTVEQAAKYLCVSTSKLYKMTHTRELKYHKVGRLNLFKVKDLEDYLESHSVPAVEQLAQQAFEQLKQNRR